MFELCYKKLALYNYKYQHKFLEFLKQPLVVPSTQVMCATAKGLMGIIIWFINILTINNPVLQNASDINKISDYSDSDFDDMGAQKEGK